MPSSVTTVESALREESKPVAISSGLVRAVSNWPCAAPADEGEPELETGEAALLRSHADMVGGARGLSVVEVGSVVAGGEGPATKAEEEVRDVSVEKG